MALGPTPWYQIALQYAALFFQLFYWIAIPVVLFLAWRDFRRLVDNLILEEYDFVDEGYFAEPEPAKAKPKPSSKKAKKAEREGE